MKYLITTIAAVVLVGCGDPDGALIQAARDGDIEVVKQHLAAGADVNTKDDHEYTPLHWAAMEGRREVAELLISQGANVNAKSRTGSTPLQYAAFDRCKEIAELLIAAGADVNASSKNGSTLLDFAISGYQFKIVDLLRKNGGKHGTIHGAAGGGDIEAVKKFLASGTHVNANKNIVGDTPLHSAAEYGQKEIVELLIANGADVNIATKSGRTALDMTHLHPEINELLRKHGAKWGRELEAAGN